MMTERPAQYKAPEFLADRRRSRAAQGSLVNECFTAERYQHEGGGQVRECSPVRDWVADWNKWSRGERVLAVVVTVVLAVLPLSLLITAAPGG